MNRVDSEEKKKSRKGKEKNIEIGINEISHATRTILVKNKIQRQAKRRQEEPLSETKLAMIKRKQNREMLGIVYLFALIFFAMIVYFCHFLLFQAEDKMGSPYNARIDYLSSKTIRGEIQSADGMVLAKTVNKEDGTESREYPGGAAFAHPIGYSVKGKTGIEALGNYYLTNSGINPLQKFMNDIENRKNPGDTLVTTLHSDLQKLAYSLLDGKKGSIICMEPSTGRILAMASAPSFDPNALESNWESLISDENTNGNLVNRATQGLYPPGSTFKLLMALEYIREHPADWQDFSFKCRGEYTDPSNPANVVHCYDGEVHGTVNLESALAESCNSAFAFIGSEIDVNRLRNLTEDFYYNKDLSIGLPSKAGQFTLTADSPTWLKMQSGIGQGETLCSPMQNLCMVSAIANHGTLVYPSILSELKSKEGTVVHEFPKGEELTLLSSSESDALKQFMRSVVTEGTASALKNKAYQACGKTGSAQVKEGGKMRTNAWFVGFAPMDDPKLAVCILIEDGETGGRTAAPLARELFDFYLN